MDTSKGPPKDIDGMERARLDLVQKAKLVCTFINQAIDAAERQNYREAQGQVTAAAQNMPLVLLAAGAFFALGLVEEGVYKMPDRRKP